MMLLEIDEVSKDLYIDGSHVNSFFFSGDQI